MPDTPTEVWLIQSDHGYEGHGDIAAITDAKEAEDIVREMNLRAGGGYLVEAVPLYASRSEARLTQITLRQQIFHGGQLGDYQELRETVWAFAAPKSGVEMLGTSTDIVLTVVGYDPVHVRTAFAEALGPAIERAEREVSPIDE